MKFDLGCFRLLLAKLLCFSFYGVLCIQGIRYNFYDWSGIYILERVIGLPIFQSRSMNGVEIADNWMESSFFCRIKFMLHLQVLFILFIKQYNILGSKCIDFWVGIWGLFKFCNAMNRSRARRIE